MLKWFLLGLLTSLLCLGDSGTGHGISNEGLSRPRESRPEERGKESDKKSSEWDSDQITTPDKIQLQEMLDALNKIESSGTQASQVGEK